MIINHDTVQLTSLPDGNILAANIQTGNFVKTKQVYFDAITTIIEEGGNLDQFLERNSVDPKIETNLRKLYESLADLRYFIHSPEDAVLDVEYDQIYIAVTDRCNLRCRHCCQDSGITKKDDLSTEEVLQIIDAVCLAEPKGIIFSGGEPLVREDMIDILRYAKEKYEGQIILSTNALLMNEKNIDQILKYITGVSISIDGYNEESCEFMRGKHVFPKVLSVIQELKDRGMNHISLSAVYTKDMEGHVKDFNTLCEKLDVVPVMRNYCVAGRADHNLEDMLPSDYIPDLVKKRGKSCRHCRAGERELYIDWHGDIYPCPLLQYKEFLCGNLLEETGKAIFLDHKLGDTVRMKMEAQRSWKNETCKDCNIRLFCQTCAAEYRMLEQHQDLLEAYCREKKKWMQSHG